MSKHIFSVESTKDRYVLRLCCDCGVIIPISAPGINPTFPLAMIDAAVVTHHGEVMNREQAS